MSEFPGRPDHPDFWLISQVLIDVDAQADSGQSFRDIAGRYLDPDSVVYMAAQRALHAMKRPAGRQSQIAAAWIDGLMAGMAVQHLKAQDAEGGQE